MSYLVCKPVLFTQLLKYFSHISLPTGNNGKVLAAIGKFPNVIGKLMIGKTLLTNEVEITNALISNDALAIYW